MRITMFEMIAARPPVVMPDENMFFTVSGNRDKITRGLYVKTKRTGNNEWRGDDGYEYCKKMLQCRK